VKPIIWIPERGFPKTELTWFLSNLSRILHPWRQPVKTISLNKHTSAVGWRGGGWEGRRRKQGKGESKFYWCYMDEVLDRLLRNQSVPFSGELFQEIQIMGILETRTLDFKNLIILSVNEGILPSVTTGSSFIPFSLRKHSDCLQSIIRNQFMHTIFYRLLQRAEKYNFYINSQSWRTERSGELSRFLQQLKIWTLT